MYFNLSVRDSMESCIGGNKSANIYLRYFFLHGVKLFILAKKYEELYSLISGLTPEARKVLIRPYERFLVRHCPALAVLFINWTKCLWRLRGYPVVGQKCDLNKIDPKYLNW